MSRQSFGAFIELEDRQSIAYPEHAFQKPTDTVHTSTTVNSLDRGDQTGSTATERVPAVSSQEKPQQSPIGHHNVVEVAQTWKHPRMNRFRYLCACLVCFGNGLNDSAPGALIPYMEKRYNIGYAVVSTIFISNAAGFIISAFFASALHSRFGRAKSLMMAQASMLVGYIALVCEPPFPVVVISFFFLGIGMALSLALLNTFVANLANPTQVLGGFHGSYGVGGIFGPLVATAIAVRGHPWSNFYFFNLSLAALNLVVAAWSFWNFEKESEEQALPPLERTSSRLTEGSRRGKASLLKQALKSKVTLLGALFVFTYQGAEVSISGWVISFLITYRKGDPAQVGYVTVGFWAGITLGRFCLSWPAQRLGEKKAVYIFTLCALIFEGLIWAVPNVVGNAVAVSIVGLALGPIYPCLTTVFTRLIPFKLQITSLSFISAMGSSGGAVAPFMTGLLSQLVGTFVLHPICIGLFAVMGIVWFSLPRLDKNKS